ncbi:hypothetical protein K431DRAFT_293443 [Polychaeton citri CBS 116435]|uniref:Uncharacterized protein n=1 Tax=Polychaeton citri CBS 116435 TaxID=1314669 RepID=A0A9P4QCV0_9PEZI|nr:hypothetical protein K431DRAFT_293443 [Polychaeton citri CBS 116435]
MSLTAAVRLAISAAYLSAAAVTSAQATTSPADVTFTATTHQTISNTTVFSNSTTLGIRYPATAISLFLGPETAHGELGASVISVNESQTEFKLECLASLGSHSSFPTPPCGLASPITITEGVSTMVYTINRSLKPTSAVPADNTAALPTPDSTDSAISHFVNCELHGGTRATKAICTSHSVIQGLGDATGTTTLASTQISYVPVFITAGQEKLQSLSTGSSEGGGAAPLPLQTRPAAWAVAAAGAMGIVLVDHF